MPKTRSHAPLLIAVAALALPIVAHARFKDAGDGDIRFRAKGPAGMKINGSANEFQAAENNGKLVLKVSAKSLKTGIGLRDKHLRGYLEADKCPDIKYEVDRDKLKLPANDQESTGEVTGSFTLHCVAKPMTFKYKAKRTGSDFHVQAIPVKPLDIRDHNVEVPCYLGVCVDPKIDLDIKFKLRDGG